MTWPRWAVYASISVVGGMACASGSWFAALAWASALVFARLYHLAKDESRRIFADLVACRHGFRVEGERQGGELLAAKVEIKALKRRKRLDDGVMEAIGAQCGLWKTGVLVKHLDGSGLVHSISKQPDAD